MKQLTIGEMIRAKELWPELPFEVQVRRDETGALTGEWTEFLNPVILLDYARTHPVRLSPPFKWPYPPENREGVAVWAYVECDLFTGWQKYTDKATAMAFTVLAFGLNTIKHVVAADPRNTDMPPSSDWKAPE